MSLSTWKKTCCRTKEKNHSTEFEKYTPRSFQLLNLNAYRWKSQRTTQKFWNGIWMFEKVSSRFFFLFNVSQATTRKLVWKELSQSKNKSSSSKVKSLRMSIFSSEVIEFSIGCFKCHLMGHLWDVHLEISQLLKLCMLTVAFLQGMRKIQLF